MIIVEGTIRVRDLEAARPHMIEMIQQSRAEDGCIDYSYAIDITAPNLIRVSERWTTRDALQRHTQSDHMAKWRACWDDIDITDRSLRLYEAVPEDF